MLNKLLAPLPDMHSIVITLTDGQFFFSANVPNDSAAYGLECVYCMLPGQAAEANAIDRLCGPQTARIPQWFRDGCQAVYLLDDLTVCRTDRMNKLYEIFDTLSNARRLSPFVEVLDLR